MTKNLMLQSSAYISYFLTREGDDGLPSLLRKKGLCTMLNVDFVSTGGISFFKIKCDLNIDASEGQIDHILHLIFQVLISKIN